jgi:hypothetical protein
MMWQGPPIGPAPRNYLILRAPARVCACSYGKRRVAVLAGSPPREKTLAESTCSFLRKERMRCRSFCAHINEI